MNYTDKIHKAKELGTKAKKDGKERTPVRDPELMKLLQDLEQGQTIVILNQWLKGWDEEHHKPA